MNERIKFSRFFISVLNLKNEKFLIGKNTHEDALINFLSKMQNGGVVNADTGNKCYPCRNTESKL